MKIMGLLPFEKEKRKLVKRYESSTNPEYGLKPEDRTIAELLNSGIINLDKPGGLTSHETADIVRKIMKVKSAGHGGTLDPRVTGVLPIALNKATRILEVFLHGGKEYVCEMKLHKEVSEKDLLKTFKKFTGTIKQLPPIKSSVKRILRERTIYYIELLEFAGRTALFRAGCEAGTYIRKLCTDMGESLGVNAHMQDLRRTKASCFKEENSITLFELQEAMALYEEKSDESLLRKCVMPAEAGVQHLKKVIISDGGVAGMSYGAPLMLPGAVAVTENIENNELIAVMSQKNELVALGKAAMTGKEMLEKSKGICVNAYKVFIEREVYPRSWKKE